MKDSNRYIAMKEGCPLTLEECMELGNHFTSNAPKTYPNPVIGGKEEWPHIKVSDVLLAYHRHTVKLSHRKGLLKRKLDDAFAGLLNCKSEFDRLRTTYGMLYAEKGLKLAIDALQQLNPLRM